MKKNAEDTTRDNGSCWRRFLLERSEASAFCFYNHQGKLVGEFKFTEKFLQILLQEQTSFVGILGLTEFQ
jgi:hypothetical protein